MADVSSNIYCGLKQFFIENIRKSGVENKIVELLIDKYRRRIDSNRRVERLAYIEDVINVIEKRFIYPENSVEIFLSIIDLDIEFAQKNILREKIDSPKTFKSKSIEQLPSPISEIPKSNRDEFLIKFLSNKLGKHYWSDFARELKIEEGTIVELNKKHNIVNKISPELISDILTEFENNLNDRSTYQCKILTAIKTVRDDLYNPLSEIIFKNMQ